MLGLLVLIIVLFFIFKSKKPTIPTKPNPNDMAEYDRGWVQFIKSYQKISTTKSEKALIERMLGDLVAQGYKGDDAEVWALEDNFSAANSQLATGTLQAESSLPTQSLAVPEKTRAQIQLDNASLLLYLGAFLLVASAGLFVAFGGLNGTLRTFVVLLVALALYSGGMTIFRTRPRFKQAGLAFVGIGMSITPLIGLAAYTYIFDKQNGASVWLATSLLCLGLYSHALVKLRAPLLNYIFIFTFLSLFESSVAVINLPLYYFGWMLALVGIGLTLISRLRGGWDDFKESAASSGMIFLPIAVFSSLIAINQQGITQFGVSLLLAAAFYGLQAYDSADDSQRANAAVAHVAFLGSAGTLWYGATRSGASTALFLLALTLIQLAIVVKSSGTNLLARNFATVMLTSQMVALLLGIRSPALVLAAVASFTLTALLTSVKQKRRELYICAAAGWFALPLVYALYFTRPALANDATVLLLLGTVLLQLYVLLLAKKILHFVQDGTAQYTYLASAAAAVTASFFVGGWITYACALIIGSSFLMLDLLDEGDDWSISAGLIVCAPLLMGYQSSNIFLITTVTALLINIFITIKNKSETSRWLSTGLWLLLPLAGGLTGHWSYATYAWAYTVAMAGLVFSRAIARGVVLVSKKAKIASFAKNSSTSYEVGYGIAATLAVGLSLMSDNSQMHTTLILGVLSGIVLLLSIVIEKRPDLFILLPIIAQALLLSALRPSGPSEQAAYLVYSIVIALISYFALTPEHVVKERAKALRIGALSTVMIAPFAYVFIQKVLWPMPFGLAIASLLFAYHNRKGQQSAKELAYGGVALAAVWFMGYAGITQVQAYVHVFIALFAVYAYWRHLRQEFEASDQYLYAMLIAATVPLTLQALGGVAGGVYGWWLLLEQIGFLVIGMSIQKKLVITWGLYVAIGAVLLQLRNLGWAALSVLALFLIGLAIFKIQKNVDK